MSWKNELSRRQVRYLCFRLRSEAQGVSEAPPLPKGFKSHFEKHSFWEQRHGGFPGWGQFGGSWDVREDDPLTPRLRLFSIEHEWNATLAQVVPELPLAGSRRAED